MYEDGLGMWGRMDVAEEGTAKWKAEVADVRGGGYRSEGEWR